MRPVSSRVRRRLFPSDPTEQATTDNLTNILKESMKTELEEKTKKLNFDFKNDRPLEGLYKWYEGDGVKNDWIGVIIEDEDNIKADEVNTATEVQNEKADELLPQSENETTPKSNKEAIPLPAKKRMSERNERNVSNVKRRILDQM